MIVKKTDRLAPERRVEEVQCRSYSNSVPKTLQAPRSTCAAAEIHNERFDVTRRAVSELPRREIPEGICGSIEGTDNGGERMAGCYPLGSQHVGFGQALQMV